MTKLTTFTLVFLLSIWISSSLGANCNVTDKIDCGYVGINKEQCEAKGCCWVPVSANVGDIPWCFYSGGNNPCGTLNFSFSGVPFSDDEMSVMMKYFLANINIEGKGGVAASPDTNVDGGGSYYYHWERDGALTMRALQDVSTDNISALMESYVQWVLHVQNEPDPNFIDVRTEPKYVLPNGEVYTGSWCRPQTDGPALRAFTLVMFANTLLNQGNTDFVKKYLWTGSTCYNGGAIKFDLDWVAHNWSQDSCDLWEEIRSNDHFWNSFNFQNALLEGSIFAAKMGDSNSSQKYKEAANNVGKTLSAHYNQQFVYESTNRQKDAAVIIAFNEGYSGGLFGPTSVEVAATIKSYNTLFCTQYQINQKDNNNSVPGILYGRYEGDKYSGGNPWVLTTAGLAQLFYRGASVTLEKEAIPEEKAYNIWKSILNIQDTLTLSYIDFAQKLASAGDSVLARIAYHVKANGFHLYEQIDRNTGQQKSAYDLTWSYAAVLKAMKARSQFYKALQVSQ